MKNILEISNGMVKIHSLTDINSDKEIKKIVKELRNEDIKAHLNYTGGTKTMSALFYHHMSEAFIDSFSSSYLDARNHKILIFNDEGENSNDLRTFEPFRLDLLRISELHGKSVNIAKDEYRYKEAANKLASMFDEYLKGEHKHDFFDSHNGYNKSKLLKHLCKHDIFEDKKLLEKCEIDECVKKLGIENVVSLLPIKDQSLYPEGKKQENSRIKINKLFEGIWLEYFIFNKLSNLVDKEGIDIYFDVKKSPPVEFQLDIVAIYGYQLTVISITTSNQKGIVKLKGFEAMHRARQLGGDEAKTIVISFLTSDNCSELRNDLEEEVGSVSKKYHVIGYDDFTKLYEQKSDQNLFKEIIDFIKQ